MSCSKLVFPHSHRFRQMSIANWIIDKKRMNAAHASQHNCSCVHSTQHEIVRVSTVGLSNRKIRNRDISTVKSLLDSLVNQRKALNSSTKIEHRNIGRHTVYEKKSSLLKMNGANYYCSLFFSLPFAIVRSQNSRTHQAFSDVWLPRNVSLFFVQYTGQLGISIQYSVWNSSSTVREE